MSTSNTVEMLMRNNALQTHQRCTALRGLISAFERFCGLFLAEVLNQIIQFELICHIQIKYQFNNPFFERFIFHLNLAPSIISMIMDSLIAGQSVCA